MVAPVALSVASARQPATSPAAAPCAVEAAYGTSSCVGEQNSGKYAASISADCSGGCCDDDDEGGGGSDGDASTARVMRVHTRLVLVSHMGIPTLGARQTPPAPKVFGRSVALRNMLCT